MFAVLFGFVFLVSWQRYDVVRTRFLASGSGRYAAGLL
jgi:hypothetical protein